MHVESGLFQRILNNDNAPGKLVAQSGSNPGLVVDLKECSDTDLFQGWKVVSEQTMPLVRAGLFYCLEEIHEAHDLVKDVEGDVAAYWHGMIHRREPDFENARYWFRRSGSPPFFAVLHGRVSAYSANAAKQSGWDPWLFTGLCEQYRFGDDSGVAELLRMQKDEFEVVLDYTLRQTFENPAAHFPTL